MIVVGLRIAVRAPSYSVSRTICRVRSNAPPSSILCSTILQQLSRRGKCQGVGGPFLLLSKIDFKVFWLTADFFESGE